MRSLLIAVLLAASTAAADEVHVATPFEELLARLEVRETTENPPVPPEFQPSAAKTFNVVARSWQFDITPSPFVVNRGDSVTINFTAADSGVGAGDGHGFLLERYAEDIFVRRQGEPAIVIQFIANEAGTFTFFCSQFCGTGHGGMIGMFTVDASTAPPAPTITSLNPTAGSTKGSTSVLINGTGFQSGAAVKFGTVSALSINVNSATSITAMTPPQAAGTVSVTVTNPDGQSATRNNAYTYIEPEPQVLSVSPDSGPTAGGTAITVAGVDFKSGATVKIGSLNALNVVFVNATTLTAVTPLGPSDIATSRQEDVTVTNPDGRSGSKNNAYTWQRGTATFASISPQAGVTLGRTLVTIRGTGFTSALATSVLFGGVPATNVKIIDAVTMTAVSPKHAQGLVDVEVLVGTDVATKSGAFNYVPPGPKRRSVRK
ncbi:MAG TPA: IPT/TIG domain-containing protein [Thermoanaerobaculia bacterium]|nr:IPT/TIG domain-containing protein [Thermoanaerobaculia bacterium]